jgi:hypothetical protein
MVEILNTASGMNADYRRLTPRLLVITGVFIACLFLMLAPLRFPGLSMTVFIASLPLFVLLLALLIGTVWRGLAVHGMARMEAWWWLSAPYSFAFPLSVLVFRLKEFGHPLAPFFLLSAVTTLCMAVWMLAKLYQLVISETRTFGLKDIVMLTVVVLAGVLWTALIANRG